MENFRSFTLRSLATLAVLVTACGQDPAYGSFAVPDNGVTSGKLATGAVTQAKLAARAAGSTVGAGGVATSASSGNFSTTSTTPVAVTNLSVTITTTGRPVWVGLIDDGSGSGSDVGCTSGISGCTSQFEILRGATVITNSYVANEENTPANNSGNLVPPSILYQVDSASSGTYTYTVKAFAASSSTAYVLNTKLVAYEL